MPKKSSAISRLRKAGPKFRLNKTRDDLRPPFDAVRVFTPSPLLHGGDMGIAGAPVVLLQGYEAVLDAEKLNSVRARADGYVVGRMVELHPDELARLDQVAEAAGDYHRFLTEVKGPQTGSTFGAWVYQKREHASDLDMRTSAIELPRPTTFQMKLL